MTFNIRKITFLIFSLFIVSIRIYAQDERRNVIKLNPLSLVADNISTFYERGFTPRSSFQIGINYMNAGIVKLPISGYGLTGEYRYHFKKKDVKTPKGFYAGPWVRYQDYSLTLKLDIPGPNGQKVPTSTSFSAGLTAFGGLIGYEFIHRKGFTLDLFAGPYYNWINLSISESVSIISIPLIGVPVSGLGLRSGLALGYAF